MLTALRRAAPVTALFAVVVLAGYLGGAAVMRFRLPAATFLDQGFDGGAAILEKERERHTPNPPPPPWPTLFRCDKPEKTCDGFTLYMPANESKAVLIDMHADTVHEWHKTFREVWPKPPHVKDPVPDEKVYFCSGRLFADGRLLVVFQASGDTPYGYGLAMLDRNSNVLWTFDDNVHHEVDIGDDGRIYALTHRIIHDAPAGLDWIPTPCLVDDVVVLSADGTNPKKVSILEAFRDSDYRLLLDRIRSRREPDAAYLASPGARREKRIDSRGDILHANFVQVLTPRLASAFPMFKSGQVLISFRELSALAVLDLETSKVVWAAVGPWEGQHCPQFLDNGRLLLLDNHGIAAGSRVVEYDPADQSFPWWAPKVPGVFHTRVRGVVQRLPNGNTFIVESETGDLREVTPEDELVWYVQTRPHIPCGRRYRPEDLTFLDGKKPR
jgi:hypothetical protein